MLEPLFRLTRHAQVHESTPCLRLLTSWAEVFFRSIVQWPQGNGWPCEALEALRGCPDRSSTSRAAGAILAARRSTLPSEVRLLEHRVLKLKQQCGWTKVESFIIDPARFHQCWSIVDALRAAVSCQRRGGKCAARTIPWSIVVYSREAIFLVAAVPPGR